MTKRRVKRLDSAARGQLLAAEVLTWCGTPFHDQAAAKGAGADCKGVLWGSCRSLGFPEADSAFARAIDYDLRRPNGVPVVRLEQGLDALFDRAPPTAERQPGEILLLKHNGQAQHLAIVSPAATTAVHAQISPNPVVKEASLDALLRKCPLVGAWRLRDAD